MRILLYSTSARGHAIAESLKKSRHRPEIISLSPARNPGIRRLAHEQIVGDVTDPNLALELGKKYRPDFVMIGPEDPLAKGIVDVFEGIGIPSVAPLKKLAQIESSKGFTRNLLKKYDIDASPKFRVFTVPEDTKQIEQYIEEELSGAFVVKYDALKGGKGVKVSGEHLASTKEGVAYARACIEECGQVVIEEKLVGVEFSLMSFVSGARVVDCPVVQDHKRAYEGDEGPNTGGMGSYSDAHHSLPFLSKADLDRAKEVNRATAKALIEECGELYEGILYGGFMAVKDGVRLIEYNARFGDPEALNVLPLLSSDFVDICLAIVDEKLTENLVSFDHRATVCKYITPAGYPENKDQRGEAVRFPEMPENARIFYGDVSEDGDGTLRLGGSRTAGIVGMGETIAEAEQIAQTLCKKVEGPVRFRKDIGTQELLSERIDTMERLRS